MTAGGPVIPQIQPWIDSAEMEEISKVIASTFITENEATHRFEEGIRKLTGAQHAIAMTNGTVALFSCLKALGIGEGDEVLVPDMTFIATANAVLMAGAVPVFCEIRSDTFCMDVGLLESRLTSRTRAIMPVHLYGQAVDMVALMEFARSHGLLVIEDAAQGVGVRHLGRHVGTFGQLGMLSFYGNKTITCGEGGVVVTDDPELARKCYRMKNHGRDAKGTFIHEHVGFNFSFTDLQAAIGNAQLAKLDRIIARKAKIRDKYIAALGAIPGFRPTFCDPRTDAVHWFSSFQTDRLEELASWLKDRGIMTRRAFFPLHRQPCYGQQEWVNRVRAPSCPESQRVFETLLSLPSSFILTDSEIDRVIDGVQSFYAHRH